MPGIDIFAHVLPPKFYARMREVEPTLPKRYAFFNNPTLSDMELRRSYWDGETRQVISHVNALPEDYVGPREATELCRAANGELLELLHANRDMFEAAVLMVPMNDMDEAVRVVREQVASDPDVVGVQIFTRALGRSIADTMFRPLLTALAEVGAPAWLHPVFDTRKPDNNLIFSWEYELSQAMVQLVETDVFRELPDLKIIVHHAGGMAPFFAGRIDRIMSPEHAQDMRRFYVDTAILGNPRALDLAVDFYGADHVLLGTDAPLGILPAGATAEIIEAIGQMNVPESVQQAIFEGNYRQLVGSFSETIVNTHTDQRQTKA